VSEAEKENLILDACSAFRKLEDKTKIGIDPLLGAFIHQIGDSPETLARARKIIEDGALLADFCKHQALLREKEIYAEAQALQNADIAVIRKQTAALATISLLLLSPVVAKLEKPGLEWARQQTSAVLTTPKRTPPAPQQTPSSAPFEDEADTYCVPLPVLADQVLQTRSAAPSPRPARPLAVKRRAVARHRPR
jgi:hypothetical protein